MFNIFNTYAVSGWSFLILMFAECIAISWCYGIDRFCDNVKEMIGFKLGYYWKVSWVILNPCICMSVSLFSLFKYEPFTYGEYVYPWWGEIIGYMMTLSSTGLIPLYAIYKVVNNKESFKAITSPRMLKIVNDVQFIESSSD